MPNDWEIHSNVLIYFNSCKPNIRSCASNDKRYQSK